MKTILKKLSLSLLVIVPVAIAAMWFLWELGRFGDWGLESGYYGQFNRVKHVLDRMPNVQVTNQWQHHDVTMEDFGFFLLVDDRESVRVDFWENSDQIKERDKRKIRDFIEEEINKARTSGSSVFLTRGTPLAGQDARQSSESAEP
jgi:hypothetical protein